MAIVGTGGTSYPDFYICLFLLTLTPISTVLNSLVIRHNFLKPSSLARNLFLLLATTDLLAGIYIPIDYSIGGLSPRDINGCMKIFTEEFCNDHYMTTYKLATVADRIRCAVRQILTLMPCYITGILATTRFIQIKYPLKVIKKRRVFAVLIFALCQICLIFVLFYRAGDKKNASVITFSISQSSWNMVPSIFGYKMKSVAMYFILIAFLLLLQVMAVSTSFLTICELIKMFRKPMTANARKNALAGSLKIMITNMGSIFNIGLIITKACISLIRSKNFDPKFDFVNGMEEFENQMAMFIENGGTWIFIYMIFQSAIIPTVLSTLNPGIYIIFTPDFGTFKGRKSTLISTTRTTVKSRGYHQELKEEGL